VSYTLYNYFRSSASWRVRIALHWKELEYTYVPVHLVKEGGQQHGAEHRARNPMEQVPVLEWEEAGQKRQLAQSLAILEFLETRHAARPLLPRDPYLAGRARMLAEIVNSGIQPFQNLTTLAKVRALGGDDKAFARGFIEAGLAAYDAAAADVAGHFSVGDAPSFADVCLVPQLNAARRFGVDLEAFSRLVEIEAHCAGLPAFDAAHADHQPDTEVKP